MYYLPGAASAEVFLIKIGLTKILELSKMIWCHLVAKNIFEGSKFVQ